MTNWDNFGQQRPANPGSMNRWGGLAQHPQPMAPKPLVKPRMTPGLDFAHGHPPPGYGNDGQAITTDPYSRPTTGAYAGMTPEKADRQMALDKIGATPSVYADATPMRSAFGAPAGSGGVLGAAGVSLPGVNAPRPGLAGVNPTGMQSQAIDALRKNAMGIDAQANPWGANSMDMQKRALESKSVADMLDAENARRNAAFAGPMVAAQDIENLNSTGRAALLSGLASVDFQRDQNAANWNRQRTQDSNQAWSDYAGKAFDVYGLKDAGQKSYEMQDTYGLRRSGLEAGLTSQNLQNDRQATQNRAGEFELDQAIQMAPQVREEARLRLESLQQQIENAKRSGNWADAAELGKIASRVAQAGGWKWVGGAVGGALGSIIPGAGTAAGSAAGGALGAWADSALGGK